MNIFNFKSINIKWILRIGVFLTFIGHGYYAFNERLSWLPYIEVFGLENNLAKKIMVFIGVLDFIVAFIVLIKPVKEIVLWACIWAFCTALIRPIVGEPIWEFIERGSNWCLPLALYITLNNEKHNLQ